jgi:hypothetical protein
LRPLPCAAIASHARAQQATELPEVTVEARKKEVRTTNTRLEAVAHPDKVE